jgi:SulP family sulfate permease
MSTMNEARVLQSPAPAAGGGGYDGIRLRKDVVAGLTVAAIAVPQAMAYALIAGVEPRYGLYAAIVVTAVGAVFGSSSYLINGPTNAISLVVFSALAFLDPSARHDIFEAMFLLAIMVGVVQIAIALFKLGDLTRYISDSVVLGFMAGAGLLIALSQIDNLFGLAHQGTGHQHLLYRLWLSIRHGGPWNPRALGIGLGVTVLVVVLRRVFRKYHLPRVDMLLALILVATLTHFLGWSQPDADGKRLVAVVGNIPSGLPEPHFPKFQLEWLQQMSGSAVAIALLGLLEALAVAKSLALQTREKLDYNRQCLAEGLANLCGGFFRCMPGSGSLTRSTINFHAGAATRWSGVFSAAATALIVILFAPWASYIPTSALAGILLITAAGLVDWPRLRYAVRTSRYDAILVLATALTAVFLSVEFSILVGTMLSFIMYVPRASRLLGTELTVGSDRVVRDRQPGDEPCTAIILFDLEGELFFGAAPELESYFDDLRRRTAANTDAAGASGASATAASVSAASASAANAEPQRARVIVLRLKRTRNPDMVCMKLFEQFLRDMNDRGVIVLLCGVREDFAEAMANLRFQDLLPPERVLLEDKAASGSSSVEAVRRAYELVGSHTCANGHHRNDLEAKTEPLYYMI